MYNGLPRNKYNFSNEPRNKTGLYRTKYEEYKTSKVYREETNIEKVTGQFLNEISDNCGTHSTHKNWDNSSKIFKLFEIINIPTTTEDKVEYAYSTIDIDEVFKNNLKMANDTSVTNVPNLIKSSKKLSDTNISNINIITNSEILN